MDNEKFDPYHFTRKIYGSMKFKNLNRWLVAAGVYNIIWGTVVVFFPNLFFNLGDLPLPLYPMIWQSVGMIVGVYGVGYLIAATDPIKHWPIVLVGLLGKIFGPIGFAYHLFIGTLPIETTIVIVFNDLIWWIPFYQVLRKFWKNKS